MRPALAYAVLMYLLTALQAAWPSFAFVGGTKPDLLIIAAIGIGLSRGPVPGLVAGLAAGFLASVVETGPIGALVVSSMGVGYLSGRLRGRLYAESVPVAALVCALGALLAEIVRLLIAPPPDPASLLVSGPARVGFALVLGPVLYLLLKAVNRRWPLRPEE